MSKTNTENQEQHKMEHEGIYTYMDCNKRIETDLIPICHYYQWGMIGCDERLETGNCPRGVQK